MTLINKWTINDGPLHALDAYLYENSIAIKIVCNFQ